MKLFRWHRIRNNSDEDFSQETHVGSMTDIFQANDMDTTFALNNQKNTSWQILPQEKKNLSLKLDAVDYEVMGE